MNIINHILMLTVLHHSISTVLSTAASSHVHVTVYYTQSLRVEMLCTQKQRTKYSDQLTKIIAK